MSFFSHFDNDAFGEHARHLEFARYWGEMRDQLAVEVDRLDEDLNYCLDLVHTHMWLAIMGALAEFYTTLNLSNTTYAMERFERLLRKWDGICETKADAIDKHGDRRGCRYADRCEARRKALHRSGILAEIDDVTREEEREAATRLLNREDVA